MIIANPIYDVVFKRMMQDLRIAKFFIETLTSEEIIELEIKPQEIVYTDKLAGVSVFRMDFNAKIKTSDGHYKNVLIEIQKSKNYVDLMRFRNYLAEQYKKEDEIKVDYDKKKIICLPIITIYLLGFKLHDIDTAAIKVSRQYYDLINNVVIHEKDDFIENLTHDSYVVQIPRIQPRIQSRLDLLLSVFEQSNFTDTDEITKSYDYAIKDKSIKTIVDILNYSSMTAAERNELAAEREAHRIFDSALGEMKESLEEKVKIIEEQSKKLSENENKLKENENKLKENENKIKENENMLMEKNKELSEKDKIIQELQRKLNGM